MNNTTNWLNDAVKNVGKNSANPLSRFCPSIALTKIQKTRLKIENALSRFKGRGRSINSKAEIQGVFKREMKDPGKQTNILEKGGDSNYITLSRKVIANWMMKLLYRHGNQQRSLKNE